MVLSVILAFMLAQVVTPQVQLPPASANLPTADKSWPPPGVYAKSTPGLTMPRVLKEAKPLYTEAAMDAKLHGVVTMEAVVRADGSVGDVRVKQSLDTQYGLDDAAVKALKKWTFAPGKKDGVAVPVLVEVEMTFSLR
jgi:protein TonB